MKERMNELMKERQNFIFNIKIFIFIRGGSLLAWSLANGYGFPLNHYFSFFFLSAVFLLQFIMTLFLPPSINFRAKALEGENPVDVTMSH